MNSLRVDREFQYGMNSRDNSEAKIIDREGEKE